MTYTYDTQDCIATDSTGKAYSFDTDGFIQTITSGLGTQTFNYDVLGSLRSVTMPSGDVISYLSNSAGKRVVRKKNGAITAYYLYQSGSQIGAVLDSSGNLLQSFVYGSNPLVPEHDRRLPKFCGLLNTPQNRS